VLLQEIVLNLLRNAMDAVGPMPPERRRIAVTIACSEWQASVTVRDRGPGVPSAVLATLFQPFTTTKADGMGIGLALSQRIAAAHGGDRRHEQSDGGATFRLTVPMAGASAGFSLTRAFLGAGLRCLAVGGDELCALQYARQRRRPHRHVSSAMAR
jgi:signal transduction histidine kinase